VPPNPAVAAGRIPSMTTYRIALLLLVVLPLVLTACGKGGGY
jgi:hypothetical protein